MGVRPSNRAVSTVADVSLALLIISASVVTLGLYLQERDRGETHRTVEADNTAETLTVSTVSVEYVYTPLLDDGYTPEEATRSVHGSAAQLLAEAAVSMATFPAGGEQRLLTEAGLRFEGSVDAAVRSRLVGANNRTQVIAAWQPYRDARVSGTATAGQTPPGDVDVSTATITVANGMPAVDSTAVRSAVAAGNYEAAAEPIARAIVEGLFPPQETQTALESTGFRRDLAVSRYEELGDTLGVDYGGVVADRERADALAANQKLVTALKTVVAEDLQRVHDDGATAAAIADSVSVARVTIIVRTW